MGSGNGFGFVGRKRRVVDGTGAARAPCGYQSGRARGGPGAARTRTHSSLCLHLLNLYDKQSALVTTSSCSIVL